jgi:FKBP-type peptidyl-prolyl cis-trans isomerase FkpA
MNDPLERQPGDPLKNALALTLIAVLSAACASAQDPKPAAAPAPTSAEAQPKCQPSPTELVVKDLEPGSGRALIPKASVLVWYTGWLYDGCKPDFKGAMFDSNRTKPVPFGVVVGGGRVIKGWDEGLVGMKEKAKRLLIIPAHKAYGEKGAGNVIPPNAALVFEVETLSIQYYPQAETK